MTRKIVFFYETGYCGSDACEMHEFPDDTSDDELNQYAYEGALSNADMYGYYPTETAPDGYDDDQDYDGGDEYSDGIQGWWEEYDAEKHEGLF